MTPRSKREWVGAAILVSKGVGALFLLLGAWLTYLWMRGSMASLSFQTFPAFWESLTNQANADKMEAMVAGVAVSGGFVAWLSTALLSRYQQSLPAEAGAPAPAEPWLAEWLQFRPILLRRMRAEWIDQFLGSALKGTWLHLGVESLPELAAPVCDLERLTPQGAELVTRRSLLSLFDESGGRLLLLGEPGSGKSVTLAKLCELLLERAERDPEAAAPIALRLTTWSAEHPTLEAWLADVLKAERLAPKCVLPALPGGSRLILLLDGLDEMPEARRAVCLTALEEYRAEHQLQLVVTCRWEEYRSLPEKMHGLDVLRLLPLSEEQIRQYLHPLGERLQEVTRLRASSPEVRELTSTPLMLRLLASVYASGEGLSAIPGDASAEVWRDAVFRRHVEEMLRHKPHHDVHLPFSKAGALHYLQQIARAMKPLTVTAFHLEDLHVGWVTRRWHYGMAMGVFSGLFFGLVVALWVGSIAATRRWGFDPAAGLSAGLQSGPIGLFAGYIAGLFFGLIRKGNSSSPRLAGEIRLVFRLRKLFAGLMRGLIGGLLFGATFGVITGLLIGLVDWLAGNSAHGVLGSIIGLGLGFAFSLGVIFGCGAAVIFAVKDGFFEIGPDPHLSKPNQGIERRWRTCLLVSVLAAGGAILLGLRFLDLTPFVAVFAPFLPMLFGGFTLIQHYATRLALRWENTLPYPFSTRKLAAYLDAMSARVLLKRVGGGWIFFHALLQDYLAGEPFGATPEEIERALRRGAAEK